MIERTACISSIACMHLVKVFCNVVKSFSKKWKNLRIVNISSGNDSDILSQNISYLLYKEAEQATTSIIIFLPSPLFHALVKMYIAKEQVCINSESLREQYSKDSPTTYIKQYKPVVVTIYKVV